MNVAEILKYCPKGTKLYSLYFEKLNSWKYLLIT